MKPRTIRHREFLITSSMVADAVKEVRLECLIAREDRFGLEDAAEELAKTIGSKAAVRAVLHATEPEKEVEGQISMVYVFRVPTQSAPAAQAGAEER